ncbi:hypothetical protein [Haloarcula sp. CBA1131]|uniref:DUF7282 domain-containing protein n=1 Tax=Haloarcula sp. CBA1131 TaxID=1853686 RepID=UPI00178259E8
MRKCWIFALFVLLLAALTVIPGASSQTLPSDADIHAGKDSTFKTTASPRGGPNGPVDSRVERETKVPYRITSGTAVWQGVRGYTNISPDSELEIEMESESEMNRSVLRPEADVRLVDTHTAIADFSEYSAETNFNAQTPDIDSDKNFSDEKGSRIVEDRTATVTISDQESDGSEVVVDSAQLPEGGFIVIHDSTLLDGGILSSVIGNSEYLEAGSHEDITITLDEPQDEDFAAIAMPHLDTNGNEAYDFPDADGPYTANGSAVFERANVSVGTPTATPTPTPTPSSPSGSISISEQQSNGDTVVVDSARLSEGGFIAIHDSTMLDGEVGESVIGHSEYLDDGYHQSIEIPIQRQTTEFTAIAMLHLDTNDNEAYDFPDADGPYTADGAAVSERADVSVVMPTATPTATSTPEPTEIAPEGTTDGRESEIPTTATDSRTAVVTTSPQITTEQQTEPPPPDSLREFFMKIFQAIVGPEMLVVVGISLVTVLIVMTWPEEDDNN